MIASWTITLLACIPAGAALLGGLLGASYLPGRKMASFLQHFVAGIVVAAVAVELLPKILGHGSVWTVALGFAAGVVVMLLLRALSQGVAGVGRSKKFPVGLAFGSVVDLFIDGALIAVAFLAGEASGIFIAISLSFCAFFLALSLSATMTQNGSGKGLQIATLAFITLMLPLGAFLGGRFLQEIPPSILVETLAFGVAALLYLGVEELLGEAHTACDTPWISGAFFLGFLLILLFKF